MKTKRIRSATVRQFANELRAGVQSPAALTNLHSSCLEISSLLLRRFVKRNAVTPEMVIDALNDAGVKFMLAGAHATGGWTGEPRTTLDVDVLVPLRQVPKAVRALSARFPRLRVNDTPVVVRFVDPATNRVVLDIMKPNQPLLTVAQKYGFRVTTKRRSYLIPSVEYMLAMKFAAMVSPWRKDTKKTIDGIDFTEIVRANDELNLQVLSQLGDIVYRGGGREVLDLVRRVRAGEKLLY